MRESGIWAGTGHRNGGHIAESRRQFSVLFGDVVESMRKVRGKRCSERGLAFSESKPLYIGCIGICACVK